MGASGSSAGGAGGGIASGVGSGALISGKWSSMVSSSGLMTGDPGDSSPDVCGGGDDSWDVVEKGVSSESCEDTMPG